MVANSYQEWEHLRKHCYHISIGSLIDYLSNTRTAICLWVKLDYFHTLAHTHQDGGQPLYTIQVLALFYFIITRIHTYLHSTVLKVQLFEAVGELFVH